MTPKPKSSAERPSQTSRKKRQNRPSQRQRLTLARRRKADREAEAGGVPRADVDEEDMMNDEMGSTELMDEDEEAEEVEEK